MKITKRMLGQLYFLAAGGGGLYRKQYSRLLKFGLIKTEHPIGKGIPYTYLNSCWLTKLGKNVLKAADGAALKAANEEFSCYFI